MSQEGEPLIVPLESAATATATATAPAPETPQQVIHIHQYFLCSNDGSCEQADVIVEDVDDEDDDIEICVKQEEPMEEEDDEVIEVLLHRPEEHEEEEEDDGPKMEDEEEGDDDHSVDVKVLPRPIILDGQEYVCLPIKKRTGEILFPGHAQDFMKLEEEEEDVAVEEEEVCCCPLLANLVESKIDQLRVAAAKIEHQAWLNNYHLDRQQKEILQYLETIAFLVFIVILLLILIGNLGFRTYVFVLLVFSVAFPNFFSHCPASASRVF